MLKTYADSIYKPLEMISFRMENKKHCRHLQKSNHQGIKNHRQLLYFGFAKKIIFNETCYFVVVNLFNLFSGPLFSSKNVWE